MKDTIQYLDGFKYQLDKDYSLQTPVVGESFSDTYFSLALSGVLYIKRGYAWDGASGPTFDSKSSMRASLVHDVFCQVMRDGRLSYDKWQDIVNTFFAEMCIEDGMWGIRAAAWHAAVELADAGNPIQGRDRIPKIAP